MSNVPGNQGREVLFENFHMLTHNFLYYDHEITLQTVIIFFSWQEVFNV